MLRKLTLAAVAIGSVLSAGPALAQAQKWHVLMGSDTFAVFASESTGPENARVLTSFIMTAEAINGIDASAFGWTVNCTDKTLLNTSSTAYTGATGQRAMATDTPDGPRPFSARPLFGLVSDYACGGARRSTDATVLPSQNAARAYGLTLFGK